MIDTEDVDPKVYATCLIVGAVFSFIGTAFILVSFLFINKHVRQNYQLLFWLTVSDFMGSIAHLFAGIFILEKKQASPGSFDCILQGSLIQLSDLTSFFWTACIVTKIILQYKGIESLPRESLIFHSLSWGYPLLSVIIISAMGKNGWGNNGGGWCWISGGRNPNRLWLYLPLVIIMIFCITSITVVLKRSPSAKSYEERATRRLILNMSLYPIILVICWSGAVANRVQNLIQPHKPLEWLYVWDFSLLPLQGLLNAIIFGVAIFRGRTPVVRKVREQSYSEYSRLINA